MSPERPAVDGSAPRLGLLDCVCLIVGTMVGSGIFATSSEVARAAGSLPTAIVIWLVGGAVALAGALCFAELATAFPYDGGAYVYLRRAYGPTTALSFAWAEFWLMRPANIGFLSIFFAGACGDLAGRPLSSIQTADLALVAVWALVALNLMGLRVGAGTQNGLTILKVVGILAIAAAGFYAAINLPANESATVVASEPTSSRPLALGGALVAVMFCYGGWNDVACVTAEIEDPRRNLVRAILGGVAVVVVLYVLVFAAFLVGLGFDQVVASKNELAQATLRRAVGESSLAWLRPEIAVDLLIGLSCLGSLNATLLTGARVFSTAGTEGGDLGRALTRWNDARGGPYVAIVAQGVVVTGLVLWLTHAGQATVDRFVVFSGLWFWPFFAMVGASIPGLRRRADRAPDAFVAPVLPILVAIFVGSSLVMTAAAFAQMWSNLHWELAVAVAIMLSGVLWSWNLSRQRR